MIGILNYYVRLDTFHLVSLTLIKCTSPHFIHSASLDPTPLAFLNDSCHVPVIYQIIFNNKISQTTHSHFKKTSFFHNKYI